MTAPTPLPDVAVLRSLFDYKDGKLIRKTTLRYNARQGQEAGSRVGNGYMRVKILGQSYLAHRVVWKLVNGSEPGKYLDHIDGDPSNNRIENLQETDQSHNLRRSGNVGCIFQRPSGRYGASISLKGKMRHVGTHDTEEDAQKAIHDYYNQHEMRYD